MTEREIKKLWKLLGKFADVTEADGELKMPLTNREQQVIHLVRQWVDWYAHDELNVEVR